MSHESLPSLETQGRWVPGDVAHPTETAVNLSREAVLQERDAEISKVQEEANVIKGKHDDLVRELFHLDKFKSLVAYDPLEARKDNSHVYAEFANQYDLLSKASETSNTGVRKTRKSVAERVQQVTVRSPMKNSDSLMEHSSTEPIALLSPKPNEFVEEIEVESSRAVAVVRKKGKGRIKIGEKRKLGDWTHVNGHSVDDVETPPGKKRKITLKLPPRLETTTPAEASTSSAILDTEPTSQADDAQPQLSETTPRITKAKGKGKRKPRSFAIEEEVDISTNPGTSSGDVTTFIPEKKEKKLRRSGFERELQQLLGSDVGMIERGGRRAKLQAQEKVAALPKTKKQKNSTQGHEDFSIDQPSHEMKAPTKIRLTLKSKKKPNKRTSPFTRMTDNEIDALHLAPIEPSPSPPPDPTRRKTQNIATEHIEPLQVFLPTLPPPKRRLKDCDFMPQYTQPYQVFLEEWLEPYEGMSLSDVVENVVDMVPVEGDPCSSHKEGKKLEKEMEIWAKVKDLEAFGDGVDMDPSLKKNVEHKRKEDHNDILVLHATSLSKLWGLGGEGKVRVYGREKKGPLGKIIKEYWINKVAQEKAAEDAEEKERKIGAKWIAKEIRRRWKEAYDLVLARKEEQERVEREKEGKKQLDRLLEQSRELLGGRGRGGYSEDDEEEEEEEEEYEEGAISEEEEEEEEEDGVSTILANGLHHTSMTPSSEGYGEAGWVEGDGLDGGEMNMEAIMSQSDQLSSIFSTSGPQSASVSNFLEDDVSISHVILNPTTNGQVDLDDATAAEKNEDEPDSPNLQEQGEDNTDESHEQLDKNDEGKDDKDDKDDEEEKGKNSDFEDEDDENREQDDEQMELEMEGEEKGEGDEDSDEEMKGLEEDANLSIEELRRKYYGEH